MEDILMTEKEADRMRLLKAEQSGEINLRQTAELMNLSYRQASRLKSQFQAKGAKGIVSKKRGGKSNRRLPEDQSQKILDIIRVHYQQYGPTLIAEKLENKHGIKISREKVRSFLIEHNIPYTKKKRRNRIHPRRPRRECFGELVQSDASIHHWFEDRGPCCALHIAIDDATSMMMAGRFEKEETTEGYWHMMMSYIKKYGRPLSLYVDSRSVFRVNRKGAEGCITQFKRSMNELDIGLIIAKSPQAKGRVERANRVLQDRLVKEFRERNISSIEEANEYLPIFIEEYNCKFAKMPASPFNAHRALNQKMNLSRIFCEKYVRMVQSNLEVQFENVIYRLDKSPRTLRLKHQKVMMLKSHTGEVSIEHKGELISYRLLSEIPYQKKVVDAQALLQSWEKSVNRRKVPANHPWKRNYRNARCY